MKKLTTKRKKWFRLRANQELKKLNRKISPPKHDVNYLPVKLDSEQNLNWQNVNRWMESAFEKGLKADKIFPSSVSANNKANRLTIYLPKEMNFSDKYDSTILVIQAIRRLTSITSTKRNAYKLGSVNFDDLKTISTSAALVLTAEISKWDDSVRKVLKPKTDLWDKTVLEQFIELGFFDLFPGRATPTLEGNHNQSAKNLVKYIKGKCTDNDKTVFLKQEIRKIVGDKVGKWPFLYTGLSEAITNVSQHAYPNNDSVNDIDKNWYLTGSFDQSTRELKIVFYDQGVGIPTTLPASKLKESIIEFLSKLLSDRFTSLDKIKHSTMLEAAVQAERTCTSEEDRGKGLQDLLQFIDQRKEGYLSILSLKGLYKYNIDSNGCNTKTDSFDVPMPGTLIIWSVAL